MGGLRAGRKLRQNRWGLSEIVGALMLVVIVVVAATALSAFIASYQKQAQAQQSVTQQRGLESIKVLGVSSTVAPNGTITDLSFTVASLSVNPSTITELTINGNPLNRYDVHPLVAQPGAYHGPVSGQTNVTLVPREQFNLVAHVGYTNSSFYNTNVVIQSSQYLKLDVFTLLENDFSRSFVPPTAVASVNPIQIFVGTGYQTIPQLDGTQSIQSGNDSIVLWTWTVAQTSPSNTTKTLTGEKALWPSSTFPETGPPPTATYTVTLQVTNSEGLVGSTSFPYTY